jgi:DNA-binding NarL/FixJ family response regulator
MRVIFASTKILLVEAITSLLADCSVFDIGETLKTLPDMPEAPQLKSADVIILSDPGYDCSTVCALQKLQLASKGVPVVLITCKDEPQSPAMLFQFSVRAILTKDCQVSDLHTAIKIAASGKPYLTPKIAQALAADFYQQRKHIVLSPRETEILGFVAKGAKNSEIANKLSLSSKTVSAHKSNIKNRLKLRSTSQIIQYAVENNLTASQESFSFSDLESSQTKAFATTPTT